ncbi:SDR family NAD(P)-dependent oxidoreductase [Alteraurantiacibacter buctensis]|uniref:Glucose 1-dehydrogenase n=1 Tax=Alteraurantiacibacter buctensis TaxID=1503981 RepID=A0A844Z1A0_9SPHN|nr:glucose 1-dehydrogenase [Alteraurantiacibacter buctensis]MXO73026.1 glucose 1-dehydrogenase [Alteraurantiacibacter buctensis]
MLEGKAIIVTGAGSGIGRASALAVAAAGAKVMVSDISQVTALETASQIRTAGGIAQIHCGDVSRSGFAEELVQATLAAFERLDGAHNNAGVETPIALITEIEEADFDRSMAVNLKAVWLAMRAQLRHMAKSGSGAIVNTASVGGLTAVPFNAGYSAAKHGVVGLSRTAAVEFAPMGIRVNALCPGLTRSGMTERLIQAAPEMIEAIMPPMKRMANPAEIAGTVVFLLSDQATYLTGQAVTVDGGATAI